MRDIAPPLSEPNLSRAEWVCRLFAADPVGFGGVICAGQPGPGRDALIARIKTLMGDARPFITIPSHVARDRLEQSLDIAATLAMGRPHFEQGLIARAETGIALLQGAERLSSDKAACLAAAMDANSVAQGWTGFGALICDESHDDHDAVASALKERAAFYIDTRDVSLSQLVPSSVMMPPMGAPVTVPDSVITELAQTALMLGIHSPRALIFASRAARMIAQWNNRNVVNYDDATLAASLTFEHRATCLPMPMESEEQAAPNPSTADANDESQDGPSHHEALSDRILEAIKAHLPEGLLAQLSATALGRSGRGGGGAQAAKLGKMRGRPVGVRRGDPRNGARLDVIATLRAAAPWQTSRRAVSEHHSSVIIRRSDFRIKRFKEKRETTAIFVVDASGSAAIRRLGEAKGAVELILADCYVRRDRVALIAFRGQAAEVLLPPTRSLQRARRSLADLPGGGGTPLASAIGMAAMMADDIRRGGGAVVIVFLTDGRANITRDGVADKARARSEADKAAEMMKLKGLESLVIDLSDRPDSSAKSLADTMDALYVPLPHADSGAIAKPVRAAMTSVRGRA